MNLPYDYARCSGTTDPVCSNCRRREPGRPEYQSYIMQTPERVGECSMAIPSFTETWVSGRSLIANKKESQ